MVRVVGLMTGTSMDALDVALCEVTVAPKLACRLVAFAAVALPVGLRAQLDDLDRLDLAGLARLDEALGRWFAEAARAVATGHGFTPDLVGSHGQTVYHESGAVSWQLGEPSFLAARLACPVVSHFRQGDIAVGGAGAPLIPFVDRALLHRADEDRVALNIGGIANVTLLPAVGEVQGFDVGPGNMIIDELARRGFADTCDRDGAGAAAGVVDDRGLDDLLSDPFLAAPPPKSCGREQFGPAFVDHWLGADPPTSRQDWCDRLATATAFTAEAIARGIRAHAPGTRRLIASGGGVRNLTLMAELARRLGNGVVLETSDAHGLPVDAKEAIGFALLAACRLHGIPANVPSATGAVRSALLGRITRV
ncbi:MAG: anhydro-N-acetylmuramic acid kinase [Geminicoccaceae bacterium]|nr:MAG: anhydro-N-acetylmuramic acid kinase [Geminicoccaceae bacterium]